MDSITDENYSEDHTKYDDEVCPDKGEVELTVDSICQGDLSTVGKLWIQALKAVLVGAHFGLIPAVYAAKPPEPPKKPPKMKYKDLPIYQSPHYDYKDYIEMKDKCPDRNVKLLQRFLLPHVRNLRKQSANTFCVACCRVRCTCIDICKSVNGSKNDFKKYMRDPANLQLRQGVLAGGTLAGFLLGGGGGIPRRTIFTSLGALAAGSLCFPKETDEVFRNVAFNAANMATAFYNFTCRKDFSLRERLPCKDELPPEPEPRKPVCPPKK